MARSRRAVRERKGVSTVEVVVFTPLLGVFVLAMVWLGFYAENVAQVQGAAQDAARMASLQRDPGSALTLATRTADTDLGGTCDSGPGGLPSVAQPQESSTGPIDTGQPGQPVQAGQEQPVTMLQVTVVCRVTVFGYSYTITESSYAPVDVYRGGQP